MAAGGGEQGFGGVPRNVLVVHDDCGFDGATGLVEEGERGVSGGACGGGEDAGSAVAEFVVGGAQVDHEVLVDAAGADHEGGGDGVECELSRGAGLHACGAGEDFGAGVEDDEVVGGGGVFDGGADEEGGERWGVLSAACWVQGGRRGEFEGGGDVGGGAAGGDAEEGVIVGEVEGGEVCGRVARVVFFAFAGLAEGGVAAGDEADDAVRGALGGGGGFGGVGA